MVITKILGGLGNQLFQYAAGRALAAQNDAELKLDLSGFNDYQLRNFELNHFNVASSIATNEQIQKYRAVNALQRLKARWAAPKDKRFYKEPFFHFDRSFFSLRPPVYIQGYFQSEKYFRPVEHRIREEFSFKERFRPEIENLAHELRQSNSVSIHLRRGDYKNAESLRIHGILPVNYYNEAISLLRNKLGQGFHFYLFSDDPDAAKKLLNIPDARAVSGEVTQGHLEDFFLMQQCRHNIIANSSFSWWAAWLNRSPNKVVIAPRRWFGDQGPKDVGDLIPAGWIIL